VDCNKPLPTERGARIAEVNQTNKKLEVLSKYRTPSFTFNEMQKPTMKCRNQHKLIQD
jgi:hypothetical protein